MYECTVCLYRNYLMPVKTTVPACFRILNIVHAVCSVFKGGYVHVYVSAHTVAYSGV